MTETHRSRPARWIAPAAQWMLGLSLTRFTGACGVPDPGGKSILDLATAAELVGAPACPVHVFLFRGLLDQPSSGLNDLADELRAVGMTAVARPYTTWESALAEIDVLIAAETPPRLAFMGHSYGADSAVQLAETLGARGVAVDLLFLIDATAPPAIPANVDRCVHIYNPNEFADAAPEVFPGNPVLAAPGNSRTRISNRRARVEDLGPEAARIDVASGLLVHLTLDSEPVVHRVAVEEALARCD
jgi:pimeloyl-ACP methyl ester carboxylesterase